MAIRLFQQITDSIRRYILPRVPGISLRPNDQHSELFINPIAAEIDLTNLELLDVRNKQNANNLAGTELDRYALNYGLTRIQASPANGVVTVGTTNLPRKDNIIPAGARVLGGSNGNISYYTLQEVTLPSQTAFDLNPTESPYYTQTNLGQPVYAVKIPIQAVQSGSSSNLDQNTVKFRGAGLPQEFNYITNDDPVSGGFDAQTDEEFLEMVNRFLLGGIIGTQESIILGVLEASGNVFDVKVIGPGNPLMFRDRGRGGKLDVVIIGSKNVFVSETFSNVSTVDPIKLRFNPVSSILSVVGQVNGTYPKAAFTLIQPEFPSPLENSSKSEGYLIFSGTVPPNDTITVTYTYNKSLYDIGKYFEKKAVFPGVDFLIKVGKPQLVNLAAAIKLNNSNVDKEAAKNRITNSLALFLNAFGLGRSLSQSEVINVIKSIDSNISRVTVPLTAFNTADGTNQDTIACSDEQYLRAGTISIVVE